MTNEIQAYILDGLTVNEAVTENADGTYTIFINGDLCDAKRLEAYRHALDHIANMDFEKPDVQSTEMRAHDVC